VYRERIEAITLQLRVWSRWCLSTTRPVSTSITRYSSEQCVPASWQPLNCRRPWDSENNTRWCSKTHWRLPSRSVRRATSPTYKYRHRCPCQHSPRYATTPFIFYSAQRRWSVYKSGVSLSFPSFLPLLPSLHFPSLPSSAFPSWLGPHSPNPARGFVFSMLHVK